MSITSGQVDVDAHVVATVDADLVSSEPITKTGEGTLVIRGTAPQVAVASGTLIVASTATIDDLTIQNGGTVILNGQAENVTNSGQLIFAGDFDFDGAYTASDIDLLFAQLADGTPFDPRFDLVSDGVIDDLDVVDLVLERIGTTFGDADVNGVVDALDFGVWQANRFSVASTWSTADFNRDGVTDTSDFNLWNEHRFRIAESNHEVRRARLPQPAMSGAVTRGLPNRKTKRQQRRLKSQPGLEILKLRICEYRRYDTSIAGGVTGC